MSETRKEMIIDDFLMSIEVPVMLVEECKIFQREPGDFSKSYTLIQ